MAKTLIIRCGLAVLCGAGVILMTARKSLLRSTCLIPAAGLHCRFSNDWHDIEMQLTESKQAQVRLGFVATVEENLHVSR